MAITSTQWKDLQYMGGGPNRLWMYHTTDAIATVIASGYFVDPDIESGGTPQIRPNDVIIAVCSTGGTRTVDVLVVATSTETACTVINGT